MKQVRRHTWCRRGLLSSLIGWSVLALLSAQTPAPLRLVKIFRGDAPQEIARFTVEVADEPEEWRRGLMERPSLAPDGGMLFLFPDAATRSFWMMNTLIRLDMLFVDAAGRIINIHANVPPCEPPQRCPSYHSSAPAQYVLEITGGRAQALGIRAGDRLQF